MGVGFGVRGLKVCLVIQLKVLGVRVWRCLSLEKMED